MDTLEGKALLSGTVPNLQNLKPAAIVSKLPKKPVTPPKSGETTLGSIKVNYNNGSAAIIGTESIDTINATFRTASNRDKLPGGNGKTVVTVSSPTGGPSFSFRTNTLQINTGGEGDNISVTGKVDKSFRLTVNSGSEYQSDQIFVGVQGPLAKQAKGRNAKPAVQTVYTTINADSNDSIRVTSDPRTVKINLVHAPNPPAPPVTPPVTPPPVTPPVVEPPVTPPTEPPVTPPTEPPVIPPTEPPVAPPVVEPPAPPVEEPPTPPVEEPPAPPVEEPPVPPVEEPPVPPVEEPPVPPVEEPPTPPTEEPPAPPVVDPPVTPGPAAIEQQIIELVNMVNEHRATLGISVLTYNVQVATAAQFITDDNSARGILSHTDINGDRARERLTAAGYNFRGWGEILGFSPYGNHGQIFDLWLGSELHKQIIETPNYVHMGIGITKDANGGYWYGIVFAHPKV